MAKIKYFYNPHKLDFEKVGTSIWSVVLRVFGFLSASAVAGAIIAFGVYTFLDSPKERALKQENEQYRIQLKYLNKKVTELSGLINELQERDANIYRAIFEAEPIDINTVKATNTNADRRQLFWMTKKRLANDFGVIS